jgi:hypothetical protein
MASPDSSAALRREAGTADAVKPRRWVEYVREVEAGLTTEERATLDAFREHYAAQRSG